MVEWNGIFRLFRFSGILGEPREVHPKFRNEIPENVCSIRSQTRNLRNFWSNGKHINQLNDRLRVSAGQFDHSERGKENMKQIVDDKFQKSIFAPRSTTKYLISLEKVPI